MGDGGGGYEGGAVVDGGRDARVGNGGANEGDCCRFSEVL